MLSKWLYIYIIINKQTKKHQIMATLTNTIKKAAKIAPVQNNGQSYWIEIGNQVVGWMRNGTYDEATCFHTMRKGEKSDSMTDYFPQTWHDNLTQAIKFAQMWANR